MVVYRLRCTFESEKLILSPQEVMKSKQAKVVKSVITRNSAGRVAREKSFACPEEKQC